MEKLIELHINDFRAIDKADIILNGITVVSGINGSGKSTMSKLLYDVFKYANDFEKLVLQEANDELSSVLNILEQLVSYSLRTSHEANMSAYRSLFYYRRTPISTFEEIPTFVANVKTICKQFIESIKTSEDNRIDLFSPRLKRILGLKDIDTIQDVETTLDKIKKKIQDIINKAQKKYEERPLSLIKNRLISDFNQMPNFSISEYGEQILKSRVPILHYIKKTLYIDTPMAIGVDPSYGLPQHWNDMNRIIKDTSHRGYNRSINNILKNEILNGDVVFEKSDFSESFKYKRNDQKVFDLRECATGIKSMALLQLLLKNRFLDENTLLIIDEPEAHLHPQWIVEYARILVLLHKKVKVKFFITSHSTDMVSAIKYISEKERVDRNVSFYVAQENSQHKYSYTYLENDIEPIFASFNKSFDILSSYVEK